MDATALAAENAQLKQGLTELQARLAMVIESNEALALELAKLKRQLVGPKSERRREEDTAQLSLLAPPSASEKPEEPPAPPPSKPPPKVNPHGRRPAEGPPDETLAAPRPASCPRCQGALRDVGATTSTRLEWRPGRFTKMGVVRPKCACDACGIIETAPEPGNFALPRSIAGNGLLARVVVDKFDDNIPLNRQVTRFAREGLDLSLSTLCDLVRGTAGLLTRLVEAMWTEQRTGSWLQADDTGLPVLDGTKGKTGTGRLWAYVNDRHVVYRYTATKHGTGPAAHLKGFGGVLLADGGSEFNAAVRDMGLTRAGCWSHARRYFFDAREQSPALAEEAMRRIGVLFDIERAIAGADIETRTRTRAIDTRAALDDIRGWLEQHVHRQRPKSALGQAIQYTLNQWAHLEVCASHPQVPIHNNASELRLRQPVVGRKNWLFAGSEGGATAAATLFSLVGSCRRHRLNAWEYLNDVLARINDHSAQRLSELTPAAYAEAR